MKRTTRTIAGLTCHLISPDDEEPPRLVTVLCHGFGAPGQDLVPIGEELAWASRSTARHVRFVFPEAPHSLGGFYGLDSRAWWMIDTLALQTAIEQGRALDRRDECPDELPRVRSMILAMLDEIRGESGLPPSRIVLGGFSQGAMLATDVALHLDAPPAALCIWSGTVLCEQIWKARLPALAGLTVLQTHGRQDPLLPYAAAELLRDLLVAAGLSVDFLPFEGPHTIPFEGISRLGRILESRLASIDSGSSEKET